MTPSRPLIAVMCILIIQGCTTLFKTPELPDPPDNLIECARKALAEISDGPLTNSETAGLLARLRVSELGKDRCAGLWEAWYLGLQAASR